MFARGLILKKAKKITYTYHIHRKKSFKNCTPNPLPPQKICTPSLHFILFFSNPPPSLKSLPQFKYLENSPIFGELTKIKIYG